MSSELASTSGKLDCAWYVKTFDEGGGYQRGQRFFFAFITEQHTAVRSGVKVFCDLVRQPITFSRAARYFGCSHVHWWQFAAGGNAYTIKSLRYQLSTTQRSAKYYMTRATMFRRARWKDLATIQHVCNMLVRWLLGIPSN